MEVVISLTLVLGVATRYGAVVGIIFLIVATALAQPILGNITARPWRPVQQLPQEPLDAWRHALCIVFGPGRFSLDAMMRNK